MRINTLHLLNVLVKYIVEKKIMKKVLSRGSLLKSDGKTLCEVGYADKPLKYYTLKTIKGKGLSFKSSLSTIYCSTGVCVILSIIRHRFHGETRFKIFDFVNRKYIEKNVVELLASKNYVLDDKKELHIKNSEITLDFVDGKRKVVKYYTKSDNTLKFVGEITNKVPCSVVTANQNGKGFSYTMDSVGYSFRGGLRYGNKQVTLDSTDNTVVCYNSRLLTRKESKKSAKIFACGKQDGKDFAIILDTFSDENYVNSSILFYDGYTHKLDDIMSVIVYGNSYKFLGSDGTLEIDFYKHVLHMNDVEESKGVEFGKLAGFINLKNGERIDFKNINAIITYNSRIL